jgi:hypothetical protein
LKEPAGHYARLDDNPAAARAQRMVANTLDQFCGNACVLPFRIDAEQANSQPIEPILANADRPDDTLGDAAHPRRIGGLAIGRFSRVLLRRLGVAKSVGTLFEVGSSPPAAVVWPRLPRLNVHAPVLA